MERPDLFAEKTAEEIKKGRRNFLLILIFSICFSAALGAVYFYVTTISYAIDVKIDHASAPAQTRAANVGEFIKELDKAGFHVDEDDIVLPDRKEKLEDGSTVEIRQVEVVREKEKEATPFDTIEEEDRSMNKGEKETTQEGAEGEDLVTYQVTYTSGKETARTEIDRETIKEPVDQIIHVGVVETIDGFAYTRKEVFESTAYTGGGRTASGTRARVGEIAVDPRVIPLGTTVYIEGLGLRTAEDTGGAIKGNIIDIYFDSYSQCRQWGRRSVTVYLP